MQFGSDWRLLRKSDLGLMVRLESLRRLTIELLNLREMVCFAPRYLAQLKTTNVFVENTKG